MFYYETPPIDYFAGMVTLDEFRTQVYKELPHTFDEPEEVINDITASLEISKKFFDSHSCWEGDIKAGPFIFTIPDPDAVSYKEGFVWKQQNNGSSFIASPCRLPWLESYLIGDDEPKYHPTPEKGDIDILRYCLKECISILDNNTTHSFFHRSKDPLYVGCQVSGRALRFSPYSQKLREGEFIDFDVIASSNMLEDGEVPKTLCQIVVTKEDLLRALAHIHTKN